MLANSPMQATTALLHAARWREPRVEPALRAGRSRGRWSKTLDGLAMGYEYMLDFKVAKPEEADRVLRSVAGFEAFDPRFDLYYFRRASTGPMPDAQAAIEDAGIYVCDNGGSYQVVKDIQAAFSAIGLSAEPREL